jgi:hypothetical protein
MRGFQQALLARRAMSKRQMDRMADMVADGWTIKAAGAALGVGPDRALRIWKRVKDGLGWQAV